MPWNIAQDSGSVPACRGSTQNENSSADDRSKHQNAHETLLEKNKFGIRAHKWVGSISESQLMRVWYVSTRPLAQTHRICSRTVSDGRWRKCERTLCQKSPETKNRVVPQGKVCWYTENRRKIRELQLTGTLGWTRWGIRVGQLQSKRSRKRCYRDLETEGSGPRGHEATSELPRRQNRRQKYSTDKVSR